MQISKVIFIMPKEYRNSSLSNSSHIYFNRSQKHNICHVILLQSFERFLHLKRFLNVFF